VGLGAAAHNGLHGQHTRHTQYEQYVGAAGLCCPLGGAGMTGRRDYAAETQRRNKLARDRGFRSYAQERRYSAKITSSDQVSALPKAAATRRADVLHVLDVARDRRITVNEAAAAEGVPLSAVTWWATDGLIPAKGGVLKVSRGDRLLRRRLLISDGEIVLTVTRGSAAAKLVSDAWAVQWGYVHGDVPTSALDAFAGRRVGGHLVETDTAVLDEMARRGDLADMPETYRALT